MQLVHKAVDTLAGTGKILADQVIQAVQAKGRILFVQRQQAAFQGLVMQFAQRGLAVQPFIIPAAGDLKQTA